MRVANTSGKWQGTAAKLGGIGLGLALAGCSSMATTGTGSTGPAKTSGALDNGVYLINCSEVAQPEHRVELDAIDAAMEDRQYYAALARLEGLSFDTQAHWLRWAQLLGQVDQLDYSEEVFRAIVDECNSYQALHGLGVVQVKKDNTLEAIDLLTKAKSQAPANADIRNDLGYALMRAGRYDRAAFELRTAYELSRGRASTRQNLIAAYYLNGGDAAIKQLQQQIGLTEEHIAAGKRQASQLAGPSFEQQSGSRVSRIMEAQSEQPARGGELSEPVVIQTLERLKDSFQQPIPQRIGESTRDD